MPIDYAIHGDLRLVVTTFTGRVTDVEFVDLYRRLMADQTYELGTNELADLRDCENLDVSTAALRQVEELAAARYAGSDVGFRTAIIAPRDQAYGIARMYQVFAEDGPENVTVCRRLTEALAWLGLSADALDL